jgi:hypothetical protein
MRRPKAKKKWKQERPQREEGTQILKTYPVFAKT